MNNTKAVKDMTKAEFQAALFDPRVMGSMHFLLKQYEPATDPSSGDTLNDVRELLAHRLLAEVSDGLAADERGDAKEKARCMASTVAFVIAIAEIGRLLPPIKLIDEDTMVALFNKYGNTQI